MQAIFLSHNLTGPGRITHHYSTTYAMDIMRRSAAEIMLTERCGGQSIRAVAA